MANVLKRHQLFWMQRVMQHMVRTPQREEAPKAIFSTSMEEPSNGNHAGNKLSRHRKTEAELLSLTTSAI